MLKEIVEFSKQLESEGIYERIQQQNQIIDKPIMVIPVKDDLSGFDTDEIYFVVKDVAKKLVKEKKIKKEIEKEVVIFEKLIKKELMDNDTIIEDLKSFQKLKIKKISNEKGWSSTFKSLAQYTKKFSNDAKGGKSIGSNKGTNSYSLLIFEGKFEIGDIGEKKKKNGIIQNFKGDLFNCEFGFKQKVKDTYRKENIIKGIPEKLINDEKVRYLNLFEEFSKDKILNKIWKQIYLFKKAFYSKEKKKILFGSLYLIFKLPEKQKIFYIKWHNEYLKKKIFAKDKDKYPTGKCPTCGEEAEIFLPDTFHNLNDKKPFVLHQTKQQQFNISICKECSLFLNKFELNFLKTPLIFPLFVDDRLKSEINFIKSKGGDIEKLKFREIIENISKDDSDDLDYYLIIFNKNQDLLFIDYICGFKQKYNNVDIFQFEAILNKHFFTKYDSKKNFYSSSLIYNYFDKPDTKDKALDSLLLKYRNQIFNFIYRADYRSLNKNIFREIYFDLLTIKLKNLYHNSDAFFRIKEFQMKYLEIEKIFRIKGEKQLMETIEEIKKTQIVQSEKSLAYYSGQLVYYLLYQSGSSHKTHAMVEPFITINSMKVFVNRIMELFNKYKHEINLSNLDFNRLLSGICSYVSDNPDLKIEKDFKIVFYAGYLADNTFLQSKKNNNQA